MYNASARPCLQPRSALVPGLLESPGNQYLKSLTYLDLLGHGLLRACSIPYNSGGYLFRRVLGHPLCLLLLFLTSRVPSGVFIPTLISTSKFSRTFQEMMWVKRVLWHITFHKLS